MVAASNPSQNARITQQKGWSDSGIAKAMPSAFRYAALFGIALCISVPNAIAQDDAERMVRVLTLGDPNSQALTKHRLTVENVRRLFAVDRELVALTVQSPDLEKRMEELGTRIDPERRLGSLAVDAKVYEGIPEIAQILQRYKMTGREYVLTHMVAMVTAMTDDMVTAEARRREGSKEPPPELMTQALRFWRSMDAALKAEAEAWKKMRGYDKGINR